MKIKTKAKILDKTSALEVSIETYAQDTLDKIDSINLNKNTFKINQVDIVSGARANVVLFPSNGEDFCSKTLDEMERYKMYVYGNRHR